MAWTAPTTRITGELITAAIWNGDLVDNLDALKDPPSEHYELDESADYTTTSTSFVDVDAGTGANTKLRRDITTTGGDVFVGFTGLIDASTTNIITFDIDMDGAQVAGDNGICGYGNDSNPSVTISFCYLITGVVAGTHTFKLQWRTSAGTATLYAGAGTTNLDVHPQFWVREMS